MHNHEQNKKLKINVENQDSLGKTIIFLESCPLQPSGNFSHMDVYRNSSIITGKMSLILVFNKTSPRAYMELALDVLSVHKKLVKYVVHLFKR